MKIGLIVIGKTDAGYFVEAEIMMVADAETDVTA